jgi:predicted ferric reductase
MLLRNSIQHYEYNKQQQKNELSKLLKLLRLPIYVLIIFNIAEIFRKAYFSDCELGLSFMFWAVCIMLIVYWLPNKKEYAEWKKTHSTF